RSRQLIRHGAEVRGELLPSGERGPAGRRARLRRLQAEGRAGEPRSARAAGLLGEMWSPEVTAGGTLAAPPWLTADWTLLPGAGSARGGGRARRRRARPRSRRAWPAEAACAPRPRRRNGPRSPGRRRTGAAAATARHRARSPAGRAG